MPFCLHCLSLVKHLVVETGLELLLEMWDVFLAPIAAPTPLPRVLPLGHGLVVPLGKILSRHVDARHEKALCFTKFREPTPLHLDELSQKPVVEHSKGHIYGREMKELL